VIYLYKSTPQCNKSILQLRIIESRDQKTTSTHVTVYWATNPYWINHI